MTESQQKAKRRYLAKGMRLIVDFYPTEADLIAQVEKQSKKQTYIKNLIRADIENTKAVQDLPLSKEEEIRLAVLSGFIDDEKRQEGFVEAYKKQKITAQYHRKSIEKTSTDDNSEKATYHTRCSECGVEVMCLDSVKKYLDSCPCCGAKLNK